METEIQKDLECVICGNVMVDPRVLDCQHAFCLRCLYLSSTHTAANATSSAKTIKCPFNCSPTLLRGSEDIRSLKKNHLISNFCLQVRQKQFAAKELLQCDWCNCSVGVDDVGRELLLCDMCGSAVCARCKRDVSCDHAFLCRPHRDVSHVIYHPMFFCQTQASAQVASLVFSARKKMPVIRSCVPLFLRLFAMQLTCTGTHDSEDMEISCRVHSFGKDMSVPLMHRNRLERKLVSTPPWESEELQTLFEVQVAFESMSGIVQQLSLLLEAVRSVASRVHVTPAELTSCLFVLLAVRHITLMERWCIRPTCHKLVVVANLMGYAAVGRMQDVASQSVSVVAAAQKRVTAHQKLSGRINKLVLKQAEGLTTRTERLASTMSFLQSTVEKRAQDVAKELKEQQQHQEPEEEPSQTSALLESLQTIAKKGVQLHESLSRLYHKAFSEALSSVRDEAVLSDLKATEEVVSSGMGRFMSLMGGSQLLRVMWAEAVCALGPAFELAELPNVAALLPQQLSLTEAAPDEKGAGSADFVSSVAPQIHSIREQHVQLLEQAPEELEHHRMLQKQLTELLVQTLSFLQKEHSMHLRDGLETNTDDTIRCAKQLFGVLSEYGVALSDDAEGGLDLSAAFSAVGPTAALGRVLRRVGEKLNGLSRGRLTDSVMLCASISALFRIEDSNDAANDKLPPASTPPPKASDEGEDVVVDPLSAAVHGTDTLIKLDEPADFGTESGDTTSDSKSKERHQYSFVNPILCAPLIRGVFAPEVRGRLEELAKMKMKEYVPGIRNLSVSVTPSTTQEQIAIPFYIGTYEYDGQEYTFQVDGQTGEVELQMPPLKGLPLVVDNIHNFLRSPWQMVKVNLALVAGCFLAEGVRSMCRRGFSFSL